MKLINLVTEDEYSIDGNCIMAVALHQQGITMFEHLRDFLFYTEFLGRFTYYIEKDVDVGIVNGTNVVMPPVVQRYFFWLFIWCIQRKENTNDLDSNNPLV